MKDKDIEKLIFGMAHQIRNPCAIILANANLLLKSVKTTEGRQSLEAIVNGVRYLESRLDEFVEFSKPVSLKLEELSVKDLFQKMTSMLKDRSHLQKAEISSNVEENLTIRADRQQILLALLNILFNAIESKETGVRIRLEARRTQDATLLVCSDNGRGIHPRDLPEVFSPFYSTKEGSAGIGLSVSKRVVEAHGGDISVESAQGKGTTVTVRFPFRAP